MENNTPTSNVEDQPVDVVTLEGQEIEVQSEPASKKRYRPLTDKTPDEYRRHRDRNNEAVRRCRERYQQRNKDRDSLIDDVKAERNQLHAQVKQLTEENRFLHDEIRECLGRSSQEKAALQAELNRQISIRERVEEHCSVLKKELSEHGVKVILDVHHELLASTSNHLQQEQQQHQRDARAIEVITVEGQGTAASDCGHCDPCVVSLPDDDGSRLTVDGNNMLGVAEEVMLNSSSGTEQDAVTLVSVHNHG